MNWRQSRIPNSVKHLRWSFLRSKSPILDRWQGLRINLPMAHLVSLLLTLKNSAYYSSVLITDFEQEVTFRVFFSSYCPVDPPKNTIEGV